MHVCKRQISLLMVAGTIVKSAVMMSMLRASTVPGVRRWRPLVRHLCSGDGLSERAKAKLRVPTVEASRRLGHVFHSKGRKGVDRRVRIAIRLH